MNPEIVAALLGTVVGFFLGLVTRWMDRADKGRAARGDAAETATEWAFRIAMAPEETWLETLTAWSESSGLMLARFSSVRAPGMEYVTGWTVRRLTELVDERSKGGMSEDVMRRAVAIRDELARWVDSKAHAHWFAKTIAAD